MNPSVARVVHYVLPEGQGFRSPGEHRPAFVVRVWNKPGQANADMIQLQVFLDGTNDFDQGYAPGVVRSHMYWATSVHQDEATKKPGTWHWPERVE